MSVVEVGRDHLMCVVLIDCDSATDDALCALRLENGQIAHAKIKTLCGEYIVSSRKIPG